LRCFIEQKLAAMLRKNISRADFAQRLQEIIERYNAGSASTEKYFAELVEFSKALKEEEARHLREGLTEGELELFDLLKKEKMTKAEKQEVKLAAQALLQRLRQNKPKVLVQEWHKDAQSQQRVLSALEDVLDQTLPASYDATLFKEKCSTVYNFIYERTYQGLPLAA
jgi:type I restriction enzyme R subunit